MNVIVNVCACLDMYMFVHVWLCSSACMYPNVYICVFMYVLHMCTPVNVRDNCLCSKIDVTRKYGREFKEKSLTKVQFQSKNFNGTVQKQESLI